VRLQQLLLLKSVPSRLAAAWSGTSGKKAAAATAGDDQGGGSGGNGSSYCWLSKAAAAAATECAGPFDLSMMQAAADMACGVSQLTVLTCHKLVVEAQKVENRSSSKAATAALATGKARVPPTFGSSGSSKLSSLPALSPLKPLLANISSTAGGTVLTTGQAKAAGNTMAATGARSLATGSHRAAAPSLKVQQQQVQQMVSCTVQLCTALLAAAQPFMKEAVLRLAAAAVASPTPQPAAAAAAEAAEAAPADAVVPCHAALAQLEAYNMTDADVSGGLANWQQCSSICQDLAAAAAAALCTGSAAGITNAADTEDHLDCLLVPPVLSLVDLADSLCISSTVSTDAHAAYAQAVHVRTQLLASSLLPVLQLCQQQQEQLLLLEAECQVTSAAPAATATIAAAAADLDEQLTSGRRHIQRCASSGL
jgi:hypothetical protein